MTSHSRFRRRVRRSFFLRVAYPQLQGPQADDSNRMTSDSAVSKLNETGQNVQVDVDEAVALRYSCIQ
jgi:hypothetical protein